MFATELLIKYPESLEFDDPEAAKYYFSDLPEREFNKLQAAVTVVKTNFFWRSLGHFSQLCSALTYGIVSTYGTITPDIETAGWAIVEAVVLTPDLEDCYFIDKNIEAYIIERAKFDNAFPFTLAKFVDFPDKERYQNSDLNNYLVFKTKEYLDAIDSAFKTRGEELTVLSLEDLQRRFAYFNPEEESHVSARK